MLQRVYAHREITSKQQLSRELTHLLPFNLLKNIDQAVALLIDAVVKQKKIIIIGDFDADGATSTTLAVKALRAFGAEHVDYSSAEPF